MLQCYQSLNKDDKQQTTMIKHHSVPLYGVAAFLQAHQHWGGLITAFWPNAQPRWMCGGVSGDESLSTRPGDQKSPGVLAKSGAEGWKELSGFVQYWLDWPCQTVLPL